MKKYRLHIFFLIFISALLIIYKIIPISDKSFKVEDTWIKRIEESWKLTKKKDTINNSTCIKIKHILRYPLSGYKLVIENSTDNRVLYLGDYKPSINLNSNFDIKYDSFIINLIDENNERFYFSSGKSGYVTFNIVDKPIKNRIIEMTLYNFSHPKYGTRYKMNISVTQDEYEESGWKM